MPLITKEESLTQSKNAWNAWNELWKKHAKINGGLKSIDAEDLKHKGLGKVALCVAAGPSLDKQLDLIKQYEDKVEILAVDKALGTLLDIGVTPDYLFCADAKVSYENYAERWISETKNTTFVGNACCNPKWALAWKGPVTFYVNKDNIQSEKVIAPLANIDFLIPASSNVSNCLLTYASMVMNYDKYIMVGYDFSFQIGGNFYAGDENHLKNYYLNQLRTPDIYGNLVACSYNLSFSARWLIEYINIVIGSHKVVNCTENGILDIPLINNLKDELSMIQKYKRELTSEEHRLENTKKIKINSPESFEKAKTIINNEKILINKGYLEYTDISNE